MPKVLVKESPIEGKGIFAARDIRKGELIGVAKGKSYNEKDPVLAKLREDHLMTVDWGKVIDVLPPICFTNHSCEPNTGVKDGVKLVALQAIKKGEEITVDYDTFEWDWEMDCRCGSPKCRKRLRGFKFLDEETKKRYKGFISPYLLRPRSNV